MTAAELITTIESTGGRLVLIGNDGVRYELRAEDECLVPELRRLKADVVELLRHRAVIPQMPPGVSIGSGTRRRPP